MRRDVAFTALGFACAYLFTAPLRIENIDGQARFEVSWSLLEQGRPVVGNASFLKRVVVAGNRAPAISYYGPAQSLLGVPLIAPAFAASSRVAAEISYALLGPLTGACVVALFLLLLLELGYAAATARAAALLLGFGSCLWPAAMTCMEGPQVALALLVLALSIVRRRSDPGLAPLVAGAVAHGCLGLTRETDAAAALPLLAALILARPERRLRALAVVALLALPFVAAYAGYNLWRYGELLSITGRVRVVTDQKMPVYGDPWAALVGLTVGAEKGIVWFSPLLVPSLLGLRDVHRRDPALARAVIACAVLTVATIVPVAAWRGDWTWGPRYLFGVAPLLHLGLADVVDRLRGRAARALAAAWIAAAVAVQIAGVSVFHYRYFLRYAVGMRQIYGVAPGNPRPGQLADHLLSLPAVAARTLDRLEAPPPAANVFRGLDLASAPASPDPLAKLGPQWAEQVAAFDSLPFFWVYYDIATGGRLRILLEVLALGLAAVAVIALGRRW